MKRCVECGARITPAPGIVQLCRVCQDLEDAGKPPRRPEDVPSVPLRERIRAVLDSVLR